eukprot:210543_1
MSDDDAGDSYPPKQSVEVGSGDFAPNPIYGDKPQSYGTTYDDDDEQQNAMNDNEQPQEYEQEQEYEQNDEEEQDYAAEEEQEQQPMQQQETEQQQYGNDDYDDEQQPAPPPYSQDPPAPPAAYDGNDDANQPQQAEQGDNTGYDYNEEPEDVVAQMNANNDGTNNDDEIDYGVSQPKTDNDDESGSSPSGFIGNFFIRTLFMGTGLLLASMLGFAIWFQDTGGSDLEAGFGLSGFACVIIFLGSIMAIVVSILIKQGIEVPGINIIVLVTMGFYITGGLFYFIGGCGVAYGFNEVFNGSSVGSSIAGIFFTEQTFVGVHAIVAGVDLWKQILNNKKWRELIYCGAFLFLAVVDFFAYAVFSTQDGLDAPGAQLLAAMYFFAAIPLVLYIIIILIPVLREKLGKPLILLILSVSFLICVVMILIGYFVVTGDWVIDGAAYFVGVGFFVFLSGMAISFDMYLDRFIPGFKSSDDDGGAAASAVPTTSPDSQESD